MEREPDLVSVVIPCYNHGHFIREAINSILSQTYRSFEIIVVNDGSTDPDTNETLENLRLPKVTVHKKENGGLAAARNFGIRLSKGEFILPLDADDKFEPSFIEKGLAILRERPEVGVVTSYVKRFGSTRTDPFLPEGGDVTNFLLENNCCGNALYRFQCWVDANGYNEDLPAYEDWDFWIGVTKKGWLVHSIPEFLFLYRDTPDSLFKTADKQRPELTRQIVERHLDVYREHVAETLYHKELKIRSLRDKLQEARNRRRASTSYKLRRVALAPLRWARLAMSARKVNSTFL